MLDELFSPEKIAVLGASRTEGKTGHEVFDNLIHDFEGEAVPVNPNAEEIHGHRCYEEIPGDVDLAVIVVPGKIVPDVLKQCGEKGVGAAIVISAGFSETGNQELEDKVRKIAKRHDIDLLGPNVLGVINTENAMNASFASRMPEKGSISFMSQSGAFCTAILDYAKAEHIGFRHFVSLGNKSMLNEVDMLEKWRKDSTETIIGYTEGIDNGREFIEQARKTSEEKPVVFVKSGRTSSGGAAASSHTGSIAGSYEAYKAAFRTSGVIEAESNRELLDLARAFDYQPLPDGENVAVVTNAGGPGVIATDEIEEQGLELAAFRDSTRRKLDRDLPDESANHNPVDVIGDAGHERYKNALKAVLADENTDAVLVILTPQANTEIEKTAKTVVNVASDFDKPLMAAFIGEDQVQKGMEILEENKIPDFQDPKDAVKSLKSMSEYREFLETDRTLRKVEYHRKEAKEALESMKSFEDAQKLLEAYGFEFPMSYLCQAPRDAKKAASKTGYPVVAKLDSPDISHKTELDGVKTGLEDKKEVTDAFETVIDNAYHQTSGGGIDINGVIVQEQVEGLEVAIGLKRDPQFGPMVMVGLGGIYIEALRDVAFGIAPISEQEAGKMIEELQSHELFEGARGKEFATEKLKDAIIRMGEIGLNHSEIQAIDINPLILTEDSALVADIEVESDQ
ncbi:acetate--CoA ligase family protein [Candidatus Nanohalococcus occultus]|uniref:acetate--CoA ligase family protein n=1 Tax=Candidatus Nanohalococcus occultus TaxID=2978047 RepID=UPI0039E019BB